MKEIEVKFQTPHSKQLEIINQCKRFNHIRGGRRGGKTTLIELLCQPAIEGYPVGVWYPTTKDASEVWKSVKKTYEPITKRKSEQLKQIELLTGGIIDFWTMDEPDSGQGRKYKRAIIDESAKAKKLLEAWDFTIRPTLTDYKGDAFIMSRPKGRSNGFYFIEKKYKKYADLWEFFHFTAYDNPYIDNDEIELARETTDQMSFDQEYLALYVDANDKPFLYEYKDSHVIDDYKYNKNLELWISFDFNVDPMSCIIGQRISTKSFIVFDEIKLNNSGTEELCGHIRAKYPHARYMVTGDVSGKKRTTNTTGGLNDWTIIKRVLKLGDYQIKLRSKNLGHADSRTLCNSVLSNADFKITMNCENLITDFRYASVDQHGKLQKENASTGLHFFDCGRYMIDANFPDFITNPTKYR